MNYLEHKEIAPYYTYPSYGYALTCFQKHQLSPCHLYHLRESIGTATLGCWRLTRRGARRWWCRLAVSWGRGARHPGQRQCAQILIPRGQYIQRDICWHSCWRVSTGCLHSSAAGGAGGGAWLGSSHSRRRCGRYLNMLVSQQVHRQLPRRVQRCWRWSLSSGCLLRKRCLRQSLNLSLTRHWGGDPAL